MNKHIRIAGIAAAAAVALLLPLNAGAACGTATSFGGYYSLVTGTTHAGSLRSSFWSLGSGSTTNGAGNDNGSVNDDLWLIPYGTSFVVQSTWSAQAYDGCPDLGGAPPSQRMVFAFSDVDGAGNMLYAVQCVARDVTAGQQFATDHPAGCDGTSCQPTAMVLAPKAAVTGTVRAGTQAQVTVASPDFSAGFYSDGSVGCELANVIPQYDVYKQELGRGAAAPANADVTGGWTLVGTGNTGSPFVFTTACASNCDVYIATVPKYNNGFSTGEPATGAPNRAGRSSTKVQAGPILADPPKPRIANPKKAQ